MPRRDRLQPRQLVRAALLSLWLLAALPCGEAKDAQTAVREWFGCPYIAEETPELSLYRERAYNDMVLIIITCGGGVLLVFVIMIMAIWQSVRGRPHPLRAPLCFLKAASRARSRSRDERCIQRSFRSK